MHVFLHGFLGQKEDWDLVFSHLDSTLSLHALNLPGHGGEPMERDPVLAMRRKIKKAHTLIGYSAGGRLCLELKARFPNDYCRVIAISAHPGLATKTERQKRVELDAKWIHLLQSTPLEEFLHQWEQQPLFGHLPEEVSIRRKQGNAHNLALFLEYFGLGNKKPPPLFPGTIFVCGKQDLKYVDIYRKLPETVEVIKVENAFHAVHLQQPKEVANIVKKVMNEHYRCTSAELD